MNKKISITDFKVGQLYLCKSDEVNDIWIARIDDKLDDIIEMSDVLKLTSPYFEQKYRVSINELNTSDNIQIIEEVSQETHPEFWL